MITLNEAEHLDGQPLTPLSLCDLVDSLFFFVLAQ